MRMFVCVYHCSRLDARLSGSVPSWGQCRPPVQQAVEASITQASQARVTQCKTPTFLQNNVVLKLETFQTNYSFTVAFYNFTDEYSWRWWIIYGQVLGAIWELDVRDPTALGMYNPKKYHCFDVMVVIWNGNICHTWVTSLFGRCFWCSKTNAPWEVVWFATLELLWGYSSWRSDCYLGWLSPTLSIPIGRLFEDRWGTFLKMWNLFKRRWVLVGGNQIPSDSCRHDWHDSFQGVHLSDVLCSLHGAVVDDEDSRDSDIGLVSWTYSMSAEDQ